jgi:hypothetical protein
LNFGWGLHRKRFHKFAAVNAAKAATVSPNITITRNTAACPKRQRTRDSAIFDEGKKVMGRTNARFWHF